MAYTYVYGQLDERNDKEEKKLVPKEWKGLAKNFSLRLRKSFRSS